jgi:hypothetical protein
MTAGRWWRILLFPVLLVSGLLLGWAEVGTAGVLPKCVIHEWTGLHCPGCGGTRAFQALAHGDLIGALGMNPFGVGVIVYLALLALRTSWEAAFPDRHWRRLPFSDRAAWGLVALLLVFTVLRNLPWWPFTLLAPA